MLHLLYILAFTILAFLAVMNMVRNLMTLGSEASRPVGSGRPGSGQRRNPPHPELVDESGSLIDEPYLVMKSISVDDARERLDALYESSPGPSTLDKGPDES
ncbi:MULTISPECIES: DUF2973 domain-containing protein [unclassified Leptolyngbya]|jgi:hypothetical protein|uniref:DUF2973 domain-containing protein n=1 Tax=unclassified Leptolyngbya TaxID=2650499 RepID=UPI001689C339|nr:MULTISPECIES: DUF2973 domain-containing protein [unclassified Leptolyngbya]MBD1912125.1 DUF2973 domain-containing protein [Leptolyngbya sp. FACHB-8]MBD2155016.1 DUF2973 domain-containing protein [Leptolyngbya sp. FACHB-16]